MPHPGLLLIPAAAAAVAYAATRKPSAAAGAPPPAPANDAEKASAAGELAPPARPPASSGGPPIPVGTLKNFLPKSAAGTAATVIAGIKVSNFIGDRVESFAGKGEGAVARVFGTPAAFASLAKFGTTKALNHVGLPPKATKHVAQTVAIAAVIGAPAIPIKLGAEGLSAGLRAIAGRKVEKSVRRAVSQLDPTKPGSLANKPVAFVSGAVKALGKLF